MDAAVVCIDQTNTSDNGDPTQAWFGRNFCPTVELSGLREWTCLLGAVTEDGEPISSRYPKYVSVEYVKHINLTLYKEFRDDLVIIFDGASYFRASAVTDLANRGGLEFVRLPAYRLDLNPIEECWRQL